MGRRPLRFGLSLVVLILVLGISLLVKSILSIPTYIRLLPGQEHLFRVVRPLTLTHAAGGHSAPLSVLQEGVSVKAEQLGQIRLKLSLLGVLPLKNVVVDVVSQTHVIPGGQAIGVLLSSGGLIVTKTFPVVDARGVERYPSQAAGLKHGDVLLKINGVEVHDPRQVSAIINQLAERNREIWLEVRRGRRILRLPIDPVRVNDRTTGSGQSGVYLIGLLLEEPTAGVGTLTFIDPKTGKFAALGHRITDREGRTVTVEDGRIVRAYIDGIHVGTRGQPGEKLGRFEGSKDVIGVITKNTEYGIYGVLTRGDVIRGTSLPVALSREVKVGPAEIRTVLGGHRVETFNVEIVKVIQQSRPEQKGIVVKVVDERLLREAGGIVQGMSGSPIIQDGKLVGAITHVFVNDPTKGFGVLAEWMVYEAGVATRKRLDETWRPNILLPCSHIQSNCMPQGREKGMKVEYPFLPAG